MTCREVNRLLKKGYSPTQIAFNEIKSHARSCINCNQEMAISNLVNTLVTSYADIHSHEHSPWDEMRLVSRISSRIQEINKHKANSWDIAIIGVRGWLLTFGAMAILLLVLSSQFATRGPFNQTTIGQITSIIPNWSEEFVSTNSSPDLPAEEDLENAP